MNPYLLLLIAILGILILCSLAFIKPLNRFKNIKIFSVYLFLAYCATLFYNFAIDDHIIGKSSLFNPAMTVFMVILRTLTTVVVVSAVISPFYSNKYFKKICQYVLPIITVLNVIFLDSNLVAMFGRGADYFANHRAYGYIFTVAGMVVASGYHVFTYVKNKEYKLDFKKNGFSFLKMFGILLFLCVILMQQGALQTLFGPHKDKTTDFTGIHRIYMYITVVAMFLPYILLRGKSLEDRKLFFGVTAMAAFLQYFYLLRSGLNGLPLHLCNTAVVMMFIAYLFNLKGVFYFSYFVNVLGAIFAIIMPNTELNANHIRTVHFWYNHINAVILPVLGVALRVYERPNLKMMLRAIGFFSIYFFTVITLNAWFNNLPNGHGVDYFFTYSDFFIDKLGSGVRPLKYNFIWEIPVKDMIWKFFPLYQGAIYVVFIALMFVIWIIYDYLYQISDRHYALLQVKKMRRQDMLSIKSLQMGDELAEPINKEAIGMIKIEHFTKQYAGSKKKSVDDFSLEIHDGEVFGFLGHNGAGKSTTIKSMVGIQSITSGSIIIDGYDISKQPLEAKLRIGYVSDNHAVYEKLTGREYINYVADLYLVSQEDRDIRIEKYVKMFNLTDAIDREIKGYSHGMKQKLVVIASLIHNPKVWILDEPLTGLDPTSAFQIKECMREHANNGNIVFFSSHVIEVVEKICDKICIISRGKLVGVYNLKELASQGITLEQLYMKHVSQANYNIDAPAGISEFEKRKTTENA